MSEKEELKNLFLINGQLIRMKKEIYVNGFARMEMLRILRIFQPFLNLWKISWKIFPNKF